MASQSKQSRFTRVTQLFLRTSSRIGLTSLPSQIRTLLGLGFVISLGRNIAFPYLAMFLTGTRGTGGLQIDPSLIGFMLMVGTLTNTFAYLVTGNLCDRFGRRRMLIFSLATTSVLTAAFAFVNTYSEFLLLYAILGVISAFYDPAQSAMIADLVNPEKCEEVYGLSYMTGNVGTMIGPLVGGFIAGTKGYPPLFAITAIFTLLACAGFALFIQESYVVETAKNFSLSGFARIFRDNIFILFCATSAFTSLLYTQLYGLLSVYTLYLGFEPYIFGIFFAVNGTMVVFLQIPIRRVAVRTGPTKAFLIAQLLYAAGFTGFMFSTNFTQFLLGVIVLTLGEITFVPASSGFVANLAPADMRGRYMATASLFFGIGSAAGSQLAFTLFASLSDKRLTWGILGLIGFSTLIGYALLHRTVSQKQRKN
jgi:MFS family permease